MSFFADLFGGKSGKDAANNAAAAQQAANAKARTDIETGYGRAYGRIDPYEQAGRKGFDAYNDAIGINGAEGYGRAKGMFDADPFRAGEQDATNLAIRNTFRRYNAGGMGNSGAAGAAVGRVGAERYGQQVTDFRNRLMGVGQGGQQMAQFGAGLDTNQASLLSGNSQNVGNIEANRLMQGYQAQQAGFNNLLKVGGAIAGIAAAPFTGGASLGLTASSLGGSKGGGGGTYNSLMGYGQPGWGQMGAF